MMHFKLEYSVEEKIYNRFHSAEFEVIPWRFLVQLEMTFPGYPSSLPMNHWLSSQSKNRRRCCAQGMNYSETQNGQNLILRLFTVFCLFCHFTSIFNEPQNPSDKELSVTLVILQLFGFGCSGSVPLINVLKKTSNFFLLSPVIVPPTVHTSANRNRPCNHSVILKKMKNKIKKQLSYKMLVVYT